MDNSCNEWPETSWTLLVTVDIQFELEWSGSKGFPWLVMDYARTLIQNIGHLGIWGGFLILMFKKKFQEFHEVFKTSPTFVSIAFLKHLASWNFSGNFFRKSVPTKVGGVLKTSGHLWTYGTTIFVHTHKYLWDNWHQSWAIFMFFEILRSKIP